MAIAYDRARAAQREWARLRPSERVRPFLRLHDLVLGRQQEILDILQLETGKARWTAFEEVIDVAGCSLYYARHAPELLRPRRRAGALPLATRVTELRHPKGVAALITPWNYPLALGATDAIPALLAGNAVVAKPDTQTALSVLWAVDLLEEAGLPEGLWQVVLGRGSAVGDPLLEHADYVAFTGSTRGGRMIAEQAARRLIGYSLELGGKNPMLVLEDAEPGAPPRVPSGHALRTPGNCASPRSGCTSTRRSMTPSWSGSCSRFAVCVSAAGLTGRPTWARSPRSASLTRWRVTCRRRRRRARGCWQAGGHGPTLGRSSTSPPCFPA